MSQSGMNRRYYQMYGKANSGEDKPTNLEEPRTCAGCGVQNPTGYRFCFHCNAALNKEQQELAESRKNVRNALNLMARDPEIARKFSRLMDEVFEKQKDKHDGKL